MAKALNETGKGILFGVKDDGVCEYEPRYVFWEDIRLSGLRMEWIGPQPSGVMEITQSR